MMHKLAIVIFVMISIQGCSSVTSETFGSFKRSLNSKSYGYQVVEDPIDHNNRSQVDYFEVRDGDCSSTSGWNDCSNDRERSELMQRSGYQVNGSEYWYAWEIFFPDDYNSIFPSKTVLGQFHQVNGSPVFLFQNQSFNVRDWSTISQGGYHLDRQLKGETQKFWELIPEENLRGKWHRIELHVKWSREKDGFFHVWVNNEKMAGYYGPTMDKSQVYFKYGIYRSFVSRYKDVNKADVVPTQKVYYRNVARGYSRDSIQPKQLLSVQTSEIDLKATN
ncbi:heparin lyase I family protein [Vibrio ziniensis]|uniref:Polysaccharide lyase n=1 Tax=Vibrio ziniensis TaxID=2711221 RepID=A0A6G7CHQ9_9VIBR|nr:heparin lyase I family protein [Vibrio ziniensis]QIH41629.1 hypothetical protein G5S32_06365 [Vibrio ziniensis]